MAQVPLLRDLASILRGSFVFQGDFFAILLEKFALGLL